MRPSTASRPGAVRIDHVGHWMVVGSFTLRIHGTATSRDAEMRLTLRSLREPVHYLIRLDCTGSDGGRVGERERARVCLFPPPSGMPRRFCWQVDDQTQRDRRTYMHACTKEKLVACMPKNRFCKPQSRRSRTPSISGSRTWADA